MRHLHFKAFAGAVILLLSFPAHAGRTECVQATKTYFKAYLYSVQAIGTAQYTPLARTADARLILMEGVCHNVREDTAIHKLFREDVEYQQLLKDIQKAEEQSETYNA